MVLYGLGGNDTLIGGQTTIEGTLDTLIGGEGDDTFVDGVVMYEGLDGVTVNITGVSGTATGQGNDTFSQVYHVIGSDGNDVIRGAITIEGGGGNDTLQGSFGNDRIYVGTGTDTVYASNGADYIVGNGSTTLRFDDVTGWNSAIQANLGSGVVMNHTVSGIKDLYGSADTVTGSIFNNLLVGLGGNDVLNGVAGDDTLDGGNGDDTLYGSYDQDSLIGGAGNDVLDGGWGNDTLVGGDGEDRMVGGLGNDVYFVNDLNDVTVELNGTDGGIDTVYVSVANFDGAKLANIENIVLVNGGSISGSNAAPVIGGAPAPVTLAVQDIETATPFANVTIADDSPTVTVTITMSTATNGTFENLGSGTYNALAGTYTITGSVATVQAALQALVFNPVDRPNHPVGYVQSTNFTIAIVDSNGVAGQSNSNISVESAAANRAPTLVAP
jgi:Ca2+-binding RTX toxin-like protein